MVSREASGQERHGLKSPKGFFKFSFMSRRGDKSLASDDLNKVNHVRQEEILQGQEMTLSTRSLENLPHCTTENSNTLDKGKPPPVKNYPLQGFIFTLFTSLFITLTSVFVKKMKYISPGQLSLVRNTGVFVGCLPLAIYCTKEVIGTTKDMPMLLFRGFLGGIASYLHLMAFRYLPLAEAAILMSTIPAVTSVMAFFYLKEAFGLMQGISVIFTTAGVLLSVRLPVLLSSRESNHFDHLYLLGLATGVGCVISYSMCFVCLRKIKHIHFSVLQLYMGFIGAVGNASINAVASTYEYPRCGWDKIFVMAIGVFGFLGHCTLTLAIQKEAVGIVTIMKSSLDIIVAMTFQTLFFDEKLDTYNIGGACLVILSVSLQGIKNWLRTLPEDSEVRKKLRLFLV